MNFDRKSVYVIVSLYLTLSDERQEYSVILICLDIVRKAAAIRFLLTAFVEMTKTGSLK